MRIAFDIDDTLWKLVPDTERVFEGVGARCQCGANLKQEPDPEMILLVESLMQAGDQVFFWSAGGMEHARNFLRTHCKAWEILIDILPKEAGQNIDICFDDQEVKLATINLRVDREHANHWQEFE